MANFLKLEMVHPPPRWRRERGAGCCPWCYWAWPGQGATSRSATLTRLAASTTCRPSTWTARPTSVWVKVIAARSCSLSTWPPSEYWQMNALIKRFWGENFAIVGFPCNQFGHQEPADNKTELLNSMEFVRPGHGFRANFTLFSKLAVNGDKESPVFTFLKKWCPSPDAAAFKKLECFWDPLKKDDISWNFAKFLIDGNGRPLFRFQPEVEPNDLVSMIETLMGKSSAHSVHEMARQLAEHLKMIDDTVHARVK